MKNKKGKTSNSMTILVSILVIGAIIGILAFSGVFQGVTQLPGGVGVCADSTGILTISNYSALVGGTDPSPTYTAGVNRGVVTRTVTSGTTTFAIGDKIELFGSADDYIDTYEEITMVCGGVTLDFPMFYSTSDNPSIRIKNDDGDFMTDSHVGATNQTNLALGETLTLEVEIQGTNGESSGEGVYVIEFPASTSANITSVSLDGKSSISIPTIHSTVNAGSKVVAFDVPAVEGAGKKILSLSIVLGSGQDLGGGVYTDWYAKQWYIDDDKTLKYGIQDSDGTAKYENTLDYDFFINTA